LPQAVREDLRHFMQLLEFGAIPRAMATAYEPAMRAVCWEGKEKIRMQGQREDGRADDGSGDR
jgi:hypothetical protein